MKKFILINAMLFFVFKLLSAQNFYQVSNCGHWEKDTIVEIVISSDTIKYNAGGDTVWIYSDWQYNGMTYTVYCPCGCGWPSIQTANRINDQGISQKIFKITSYKYIERTKNEYELKLEELKNSQ